MNRRGFLRSAGEKVAGEAIAVSLGGLFGGFSGYAVSEATGKHERGSPEKNKIIIDGVKAGVFLTAVMRVGALLNENDRTQNRKSSTAPTLEQP